jgi:hypothetical protein
MNITSSVFFSTLVFSLSAYGATVDRAEIRGTEAPTQFTAPVDEYTISPAPVVPAYEKPEPEFSYTADKSLFFKIGQYTFWNESETYHPIGVTFSDYTRNMDALEYGFDIKRDVGRLFFGKKYYFNITGKVRTFYKWDLGLNIDPDDGFANLVDFKKYMLGFNLGSEFSFSQRSGFRFEAGGYRSRDDTVLQVQAGYMYSW